MCSLALRLVLVNFCYIQVCCDVFLYPQAFLLKAFFSLFFLCQSTGMLMISNTRVTGMGAFHFRETELLVPQ